MVAVMRITHVPLAMPAGQEDAAPAFYGAPLALTEVPKPEALAARSGCWYALGGEQQLHLGVETRFQPADLLFRGKALGDPAVGATLDVVDVRRAGGGGHFRRHRRALAHSADE